MSFRDWKKVYNPVKGQYMYQRHDGGEFFHSIQNIAPHLLVPGITGRGHQPYNRRGVINEINKTVEETSGHIGDEILKRLKYHTGAGVKDTSIENRLKNLIFI